MVSLFEGNERERIASILAELREGHDVALVSDAGMPSVSDPGYRLVRAAADEGFDVTVVPGPSAVTAALVVSGLPMDRWVFEGFLPRKAGDRRERLLALANDPRTVVLFESPLRLATLLRDVLAELGDRQVAVCRELTKLHEEVVRGTTSEALAHLSGSAAQGRGRRGPRGRRPGARRRRSTTWSTRRGGSSTRGCASARPRPPLHVATRPARTRSTKRCCAPRRSDRGGRLLRLGWPDHGPRRLLHHDTDLLPERRAAHRPRVHLGGGRRRRPLPPAARRGGPAPHRDR